MDEGIPKKEYVSLFLDTPEGKETLKLMDEFTSLLSEAQEIDDQASELLKKKEPIQKRILEIKQRWKVLKGEKEF